MHQTGVYEDRRICTSLAFLYVPFSSQHLIRTSVFLAVSSSHTDHVAQGRREREANLVHEKTSKRHNGLLSLVLRCLTLRP